MRHLRMWKSFTTVILYGALLAGYCIENYITNLKVLAGRGLEEQAPALGVGDLTRGQDMVGVFTREVRRHVPLSHYYSNYFFE
jgi:hypothetical protein